MSDVQSGILNNTTREDEPETIVSTADNPFDTERMVVDSDSGEVEVMFTVGYGAQAEPKTRRFKSATFRYDAQNGVVEVLRGGKHVGLFTNFIYARLV
jgi:hypothetical protein